MSSIYAPKSIAEMIPFEVISYTFTFLDPSDSQNSNLPTTLSLVCTTWRQIALDTTTLWTVIRVRVKTKPLTKDIIDASREWLRRSRQRACHFHLEFPLKVQENTLGSIVSELIQPVASRLETLTLCVPAPFLGDFANITPFQFPRLQSFTITFPKDDRSPLAPFKNLPADAFSRFTSLRNLDLRHAQRLGLMQNHKTSFPWAGLTHLKLHDKGISANESRDIFCLSTNLVHCELAITGWPGHLAPTQHPPCIHPRLRFLKLEFSSGNVSPFFAPLSLPKLEDFRLRAESRYVGDVRQIYNALLNLAARHPIEGLKRFELEGIPGPVDVMIEFLKSNEEIETLRLDECELCDEAFLCKLVVSTLTTNASFYTPSAPIIKLKHIWLKGTRHTYPTWSFSPSHSYREAYPKDNTVHAFVKSRSPMEGGALKKAVLDNYRIENPGILKELTKMKEGGMVLDINGLQAPQYVLGYGRQVPAQTTKVEERDWFD